MAMNKVQKLIGDAKIKEALILIGGPELTKEFEKIEEAHRQRLMTNEKYDTQRNLIIAKMCKEAWNFPN